MRPVLVTGAAGFIGFHVARRQLAAGRRVVGLDNLNGYYDPALKRARLAELRREETFFFVESDVADAHAVETLFEEYRFGTVVHLAAQAGVRHSLEAPFAYTHANITGFLAVLEACRRWPVDHLVYASSSSVYGATTKIPFSEHLSAEHPLSLYGATKKANELLAHCYAHLFRIPATGLRFFTVYGPWGRPDMALFLFTEAILKDEPIRLFGHGQMARDFTFIDDIVEGVTRVADRPATGNALWSGTAPDPASSAAPHRVYNIGNDRPVSVLRLIEILETCLGRKARTELLPMQPGEVPVTAADVTDLRRDFGFAPGTSIEDGVERFVHWYRGFYGV